MLLLLLPPPSFAYLSTPATSSTPDHFGYMPYEQADSPEVRVLLGGPDQRLFDYAGEWHNLWC
jgi:hypothetical protein